VIRGAQQLTRCADRRTGLINTCVALGWCSSRAAGFDPSSEQQPTGNPRPLGRIGLPAPAASWEWVRSPRATNGSMAVENSMGEHPGMKASAEPGPGAGLHRQGRAGGFPSNGKWLGAEAPSIRSHRGLLLAGQHSQDIVRWSGRPRIQQPHPASRRRLRTRDRCRDGQGDEAGLENPAACCAARAEAVPHLIKA